MTDEIKAGDKPTVALTGTVRKHHELTCNLDSMKPGDIVFHLGWPHVVIDAGPEQGNRIAAFREPFGWKVVKE